jgi:hypothetical protein
MSALTPTLYCRRTESAPSRRQTEAGMKPYLDVFTASTPFRVMESIRLDLGCPSYVHPR